MNASNQCIHGHLARVCELCEKDTDIASLLYAYVAARDAILNGRGPLEAVLDGDQTNAVLAVLDDHFVNVNKMVCDGNPHLIATCPSASSAEPKPRFDKTYCSQCGGEFGPGDHGYSHCASHRQTSDAASKAQLLAALRDVCETYWDSKCTPAGLQRACQRMQMLARAAIAKAEDR